MIQATCTEKIRNKQGIIIAYRIKDCNGKIIELKPYVLKDLINKNAISVNNLTLTSDNRLIDKKVSIKETKMKENIAVKAAYAVAFLEKLTLGMDDDFEEIVEYLWGTAGIQLDASDMEESQIDTLHIKAYIQLFTSKDKVGIALARFAENFYENHLDDLLVQIGYLESSSYKGKLEKHINNLELFSRLLMNKDIISEETYGLISSIKLDVDSIDKDICSLGYKIGYNYFRYLDEKYFLRMNDTYTVGNVTVASDIEKGIGDYVIHAAYNCSELPNNVSIVVGFRRDKKNTKRIIMNIQRKITDYETESDKYNHIKTVETNRWDYNDISKAIALEINSIAKREIVRRS